MNSNKYMNLRPAPVNPNFDKMAAFQRQHTMSLYVTNMDLQDPLNKFVKKGEKTEFYNEFMTRPDNLCSEDQKKMKFFMAKGAGDKANIPRSFEKQWGKEFKNLEESGNAIFDKHAFDQVKPQPEVEARSSKAFWVDMNKYQR